MTTPTTDQVKAAYKAGAEHMTMSGTYVTQPMMEADFEDWLRGVRNDARGPCTCEPYWPGSDGPSEDCAQHGRPYAYWVEGVNVVMARETVLQERLDTILKGHVAVDISDNPRDRQVCDGCRETWPCTTYKIAKGVEA